jgi:hypothetical protein
MRVLGAIVTVVLLAVVFLGTAEGNSRRVDLLPRADAPRASGEVKWDFQGGHFIGKMKANKLPAQEFGSGRFYGLWFVRLDTGDKAFLGAAINKRSIILFAGGKGELEFRATHFTDPSGPNVGRPITLGPRGTNFFILLFGNNLNGRTPSPVGEALAATF